MIKLGDHVHFLNEPLHGVVTSLIGNNAGVTIDEDFELPVLVSQIVKVENVSNDQKPQERPTVPKNIALNKHAGIYIAFERITDNNLQLQLHNCIADVVFCGVYQNKTLTHKLVTNYEQTIIIGNYLLSDFSTWPEFTFVITPLTEQFTLQKTITRKYKFSAKEFHASFKQCYFLGKQAYTFKVDEQITPESLLKLSKHDFSSPSAIATNQNNKSECIIDLHIEQLTYEHKGLTPTEMVAIQMEAVNNELNKAHINKIQYLIFIHGVGNQYLKNKITRFLNTQKDIVKSFADADSLIFGGGATKVNLH